MNALKPQCFRESTEEDKEMNPIKIKEFPGSERIRFFADHDELLKFLAEIRWNLTPQLELHVDDPSVSVQVYANRNGNKSIVGL
jgi:hypothetical protein